MIYRVIARFRTDTAAELRRRLDDGSIAAQQPDGQELVDPPLAHERATILDHYFNDIVTLPIEDYQEYEGRPFLNYLEAQPSR